jgi:RNA ligase (TIGR02306 family)
MSKVYPSAEVIYKIEPHPNADRLEVAYIIGTTAVVPKDTFKVYDMVDFFPPDVTMSEETANKLGVLKYLKSDTVNNVKVVKAVKIRGVVSYGIVIKSPVERVRGQDLSSEYNTGKYEPQEDKRLISGDGSPKPLWCHTYTDIQHYYRNANVIVEGEEVYVSEKIHGTNNILAMDIDGTMHCGSHHVMRKKIDVNNRISVYWKAEDVVRPLLKELVVMVFGETYGPGVQFMHYGLKYSAFAVFDINVGGKYLDYSEFVEITSKYKVPTVPIIYVGPFRKELVGEWTDGHTLHAGTDNIKGFSGREGCVIKPVVERWDSSVGRVILKSVSADYLSTNK